MNPGGQTYPRSAGGAPQPAPDPDPDPVPEPLIFIDFEQVSGLGAGGVLWGLAGGVLWRNTHTPFASWKLEPFTTTI